MVITTLTEGMEAKDAGILMTLTAKGWRGGANHGILTSRMVSCRCWNHEVDGEGLLPKLLEMATSRKTGKICHQQWDHDVDVKGLAGPMLWLRHQMTGRKRWWENGDVDGNVLRLMLGSERRWRWDGGADAWIVMSMRDGWGQWRGGEEGAYCGCHTTGCGQLKLGTHDYEKL